MVWKLVLKPKIQTNLECLNIQWNFVNRVEFGGVWGLEQRKGGVKFLNIRGSNIDVHLFLSHMDKKKLPKGYEFCKYSGKFAFVGRYEASQCPYKDNKIRRSLDLKCVPWLRL